jgi:hypothetical protein
MKSVGAEREVTCPHATTGECPHLVAHRRTMRYEVRDPERVRARTLRDLARLGGWVNRTRLHEAGHYRYVSEVRDRVLGDLVAEGRVVKRDVDCGGRMCPEFRFVERRGG